MRQLRDDAVEICQQRLLVRRLQCVLVLVHDPGIDAGQRCRVLNLKADSGCDHSLVLQSAVDLE